jgi:hypothetical protein
MVTHSSGSAIHDLSPESVQISHARSGRVLVSRLRRDRGDLCPRQSTSESGDELATCRFVHEPNRDQPGVRLIERRASALTKGAGASMESDRLARCDEDVPARKRRRGQEWVELRCRTTWSRSAPSTNSADSSFAAVHAETERSENQIRGRRVCRPAIPFSAPTPEPCISLRTRGLGGPK